MSMQAQIRGWVDEALHAVLDPLFERIDKIEKYILALEQADQIPADPAPRGKGPEVKAAKEATARAVTEAVRQAPPSGAVRSGRPTTAAKGRSDS